MRERRRRARWDPRLEEDPLAGLVNLFDLWMVFSIALLIVFAGAARKRAEKVVSSKRVAMQDARAIEQFRVSREALNSTGEKLGTAYRLPSGEVVCVPDDAR